MQRTTTSAPVFELPEIEPAAEYLQQNGVQPPDNEIPPLCRNWWEGAVSPHPVVDLTHLRVITTRMLITTEEEETLCRSHEGNLSLNPQISIKQIIISVAAVHLKTTYFDLF